MHSWNQTIFAIIIILAFQKFQTTKFIEFLNVTNEYELAILGMMSVSVCVAE